MIALVVVLNSVLATLEGELITYSEYIHQVTSLVVALSDTT